MTTCGAVCDGPERASPALVWKPWVMSVSIPCRSLLGFEVRQLPKKQSQLMVMCLR